jgi:hypothetical protein
MGASNDHVFRNDVSPSRVRTVGCRAAEIPAIAKITGCMVKHRADLSPGCRAVMGSRYIAEADRALTSPPARTFIPALQR